MAKKIFFFFFEKMAADKNFVFADVKSPNMD